MLTHESRRAVARLARAVLSVRPLVDVLEPPVRVLDPSGGDSGAARLLRMVAARAGAPQLTPHAGAADLAPFELVVSKRLDLGAYGESAAAAPSPGEVDEVVDEVVGESFERRYNCSRLLSHDGAPLRAYAGGARDGKAVVIASACGMPAKLCERWMDFLGRDRFVITWESRGLFEEPADFDALGYDVAAQAADMFAVMDHFGVREAHVMGLCGGAVIALAAAAERPERVSSMSLWHGDFEFSECPKTIHQQHLNALIAMASEGRESAAAIYKLFTDTVLTNARADVAHLILYPYASAELFYRYSRLNGSIMCTDVSPVLGKVTRPALVVTSEDDSTAHPAGSMRVAEGLPGATLRVEAHGDHLSLFDAEPHVTELAARFIAAENEQGEVTGVL